MSASPSDRAIWSLEATHTQKAILLALQHLTDVHLGACWPSLATIARMISVDVRTVRRVLAELEQRGLLLRTRRKNELGGDTSYVFTVSLGGGGEDRRSGGGEDPRSAPGQVFSVKSSGNGGGGEDPRSAEHLSGGSRIPQSEIFSDLSRSPLHPPSPPPPPRRREGGTAIEVPEELAELVDELFGAVSPRLVDAKLELLLAALETPARVRKYLRAVAGDPSIQRGDGVPFAKACARWRIAHWCQRLQKTRARAPEPTPAPRVSSVVAKQNTERAARLVATLGK